MTTTSETGQNSRQVDAEVQLGSVEALTLKLRARIAQKLLAGEGSVEEVISELVAGAGKEVKFKAGVTEDVVDVELTDTGKKRELSPEASERTLSSLESRFRANDHLHEGCDWSAVKSALEANPEALWSISQMEAQGHMPDVYNFDANGFDIGTCSEETPASGRNCVYDEEAAAWLRVNYPNDTFNGNAVEMAEAMGIELMSEAQYKDVLQSKGKFDRNTWSFLKTDAKTRRAGYALRGNRYGYGVYVRRRDAHSHNDRRAWRGSLRVSWAQTLNFVFF